jgi:hypothetical protein
VYSGLQIFSQDVRATVWYVPPFHFVTMPSRSDELKALPQGRLLPLVVGDNGKSWTPPEGEQGISNRADDKGHTEEGDEFENAEEFDDGAE